MNLLFDMVYKHADAAWGDGALTVGMLTGFMTDWRADEVRWSDSVVKTVAAESAENNALISGWAKNWIGRAIEAGRAWSASLLAKATGGAAADKAARSRGSRVPVRSAWRFNRGIRTMAQVASITLLNNDDARPIIEAVIADNPGVRVLNMPGAVKLDCDEEIVVKRASVEERLGRNWDPQEIHLVDHLDGGQSRRGRRPVRLQLETLRAAKKRIIGRKS